MAAKLTPFKTSYCIKCGSAIYLDTKNNWHHYHTKLHYPVPHGTITNPSTFKNTIRIILAVLIILIYALINYALLR